MLVLFLLMSVRIKSPERNPMSLLGLKCLCHVKKKKKKTTTYNSVFHIQNEKERGGGISEGRKHE